MAKLSELVSVLSDISGIPAGTCREVSRRLREADLIQTGKGGRYGGAHMTAEDAAALLTALMLVRTSAGSLNNIVRDTDWHLKWLRAYGGNDRVHLDCWERRLGLRQLCALPKGHTFGEALSALINSVSVGEFDRCLERWVRDPRPGVSPAFAVRLEITSSPWVEAAKIEFDIPSLGILNLFYYSPGEARTVRMYSPRNWSEVRDGEDLRVTAAVREATLKTIGILLRNGETDSASDRGNGKR